MITVPSDPIRLHEIKHFKVFRKGLSPSANLKPPRTISYTNKVKEYQLDPLGAAFARSLRWIKTYLQSKVLETYFLYFTKSATSILSTS